MFALAGVLSVLYFVIVLAIVGFVLKMIFRSVKALEKIADTFEKKNSSF